MPLAAHLEVIGRRRAILVRARLPLCVVGTMADENENPYLAKIRSAKAAADTEETDNPYLAKVRAGKTAAPSRNRAFSCFRRKFSAL